MHRQDELRTQPAIERGEFGLPRMAAAMDMPLLFGDGKPVLRREMVHEPSDRELVARGLFRREEDGVARLQLYLMALGGHPAGRGALLGPASTGRAHVCTTRTH